MTAIEVIWYCLVGVYLFWITLVATAVTVFAVQMYRGLRDMLVSPPKPRVVARRKHK